MTWHEKNRISLLWKNSASFIVWNRSTKTPGDSLTDNASLCLSTVCSAFAPRVWFVPLAAVDGVWLGQCQRRCGDPVCVFSPANSALRSIVELLRHGTADCQYFPRWITIIKKKIRFWHFRAEAQRETTEPIVETNNYIIVLLQSFSVFLGMMMGGYLWGYLADQRGRCRVLVVSLTINGVFGGLASLAPWFWLFLLMRFISGIGWAYFYTFCLHEVISLTDAHWLKYTKNNRP